ncbi:hypothetical protein NPIL_48731 [Nephila pilipes]|uniref:Uncharacterized protein n=1 Tax=Nephila pilipes TaxID=299642 RepID=A0A8X6MFQ7_NEPPI|nr:hypothetical protein NPIL_48731 [Nephila pilipes]
MFSSSALATHYSAVPESVKILQGHGKAVKKTLPSSEVAIQMTPNSGKNSRQKLNNLDLSRSINKDHTTSCSSQNVDAGRRRGWGVEQSPVIGFFLSVAHPLLPMFPVTKRHRQRCRPDMGKVPAPKGPDVSGET